MFKYSLEPYRFNRSKHSCPNCHRYSFTRYIDNETGQYLADDVGRCDHINSCGYHKPPREYFENNNTTNVNYKLQRSRYKIKQFRHEQMQECKVEKRVQKEFIPIAYVKETHKPNSTFVLWLCKLFKDQKPKVKEVYDKYMLGRYGKKVIFWQIDTDGKVHDGKIMDYGNDGHRQGNPNWIVNLMRKDGALPVDFVSVKCLFGEHLLKDHPEATVFVVESEKTAIICSIVFPQFVWLATGGCQALNINVVKPLKGRRVVICPDSGQLEHWRNIMKQTEGIDYSFLDIEEEETNSDIADLLLREKQEN